MNIVNMIRGVEFLMEWEWVYGDTPKDLTDYKISIQIRPSAKSSQIISTFDRTSPYVTIDDINGRISLNIPPSATLAYTFTSAVIDCWLVDNADTDGERSVMNKINLEWGVTR